MVFGHQEDVTENVGHFLAEFFGDLIFGFVFLACFAGHHEVALDKLPHFFLELEDVPVTIATNPEFFGVGVGNFFDLPSHLVDVHG